MSKRKPKAKEKAPPRFVILGPTAREMQFINAEAAAAGKAMLTAAEFFELAFIASRIPPDGRRVLPGGCRPTAAMSLRNAARLLCVDSKSTRFRERFIDSGRLAANREGSLWRFDDAEFQRVKSEERSSTSDKRRRASRT